MGPERCPIPSAMAFLKSLSIFELRRVILSFLPSLLHLPAALRMQIFRPRSRKTEKNTGNPERSWKRKEM